jgi:hypothetical protein
MELLAVAVEQALSLCSGDGGRVVLVQWFRSSGGGGVVKWWFGGLVVVKWLSVQAVR